MRGKMKVKFNSPREIDEILYTKGVHEVDDKLAKHWYFLAGVNNGVIVILTEPKKEASAGKEIKVTVAISEKQVDEIVEKATKKAQEEFDKLNAPVKEKADAHEKKEKPKKEKPQK